jgi:signal transduction histidine kinase
MFDTDSNNKGGRITRGFKSQNSRTATRDDIENLLHCRQLLTAMSRDMRNQLNAVVASSYLLNKKEYSDEEKDHFLNLIYESCDQVILLFDNYVESAISGDTDSVIESKICNPDKFFNDLFAEFRGELKKEKFRDLTLVTERQPLKDCEYLVDIHRLSRTVKTLFRNSLRNTRSGYIKIGYSLAGKNLSLYILDSGDGYEKTKELLMESDLSLSLIKFNDPVSAINMILVRSLIQSMGGTYRVDSNGLSGTGIYIAIPIRNMNHEDLTNNQINTMLTL